MTRIPEAELVKKTVTFRVMKVPDDPVMPKDSLLRWLCLCLGLISENESRDTVVRVLDSVLSWQAKGVDPTAEEIAEEVPGASEKTVRYHLKRMCDAGVLEKNGKKYSLTRADDDPRLLSFPKAFFLRNADEASAPAEKVFARLLEKYSR